MDESSGALKSPQPDVITVKQGILNIKSFIKYLVGEWKLILLAAVICGAAGIVYATMKKAFYTAELTFVLEDPSSNNGMSQYSALASMAGIDLGSNGGLFQGDNIIQLYKSRSMLEETLLTKVSFPGKQQLLIDRYIQLNDLRKAWMGKNDLRNIDFDIPKNKFTLQHDSIITMVANDINKNYLTVDKPDKKLSIISVKVKSTDKYFAKAFTEAIVNNVNEFYIETKTKNSLQNLKLFQRQSDSLRAVISSSMRGQAAALDANPDANPSLQVLKVQSQRKQVDVASSTALYAEVVKNLEISKGVLQRETPLIQVIDRPVLPLPNDKTGRLKGLISGGFIGVILSLVLLSVRKLYNNILS
jgi:hypothetical protein